MGNESSSPKKLFEQLDQTRDGFLTLDDLHLTLGKAVDCPLTESPLMLYKFDTGQDGALGREEFEKYMKKIDKLSKLTEKKKKKILNKLKRAYNEEMQERQCWVTLDETTASLLDFSRDSETPALIGASPNSYEPHPFEENIDLVDLKKKKYLKHVLERVELRSMYMQWLFRLADVDGDGDLELEELELILKALEQDGIQTKNLSFEKKEGMSVAQSLLDEYDHDKTGFVTKAEFMVLADLIMRHYEAQSTQKVPKRTCLKLVCEVGKLKYVFDRDNRTREGSENTYCNVNWEWGATVLLEWGLIKKLERSTQLKSSNEEM